MRILIPTDAFPPVCGGSGWSTYELARGLRARLGAAARERAVRDYSWAAHCRALETAIQQGTEAALGRPARKR